MESTRSLFVRAPRLGMLGELGHKLFKCLTRRRDSLSIVHFMQNPRPLGFHVCVSFNAGPTDAELLARVVLADFALEAPGHSTRSQNTFKSNSSAAQA
jgi:hypothetical protein